MNDGRLTHVERVRATRGGDGINVAAGFILLFSLIGLVYLVVYVTSLFVDPALHAESPKAHAKPTAGYDDEELVCQPLKRTAPVPIQRCLSNKGRDCLITSTGGISCRDLEYDDGDLPHAANP